MAFVWYANLHFILPGVYAGLITKVDPTTTTTNTNTTTTTTTNTAPFFLITPQPIELQSGSLRHMKPLDQPHHVNPPTNFRRPPKILFWDIFGPFIMATSPAYCLIAS